MALTIKDIAAALGAEAFGAIDLSVTALAEPHAAGADDLALAMSPRYGDALGANNDVQAAVVWAGADWAALGLLAAIVVDRPRLAMAGLTQAFAGDGANTARGVYPMAVVDPTAQIGNDVAIGPFCVIGAGAVIGDRAVLESHVTIAEGAQIGVGTYLHSGVRIMRRVTIGAACIVHPNVVIGADGFSFVTATPSNAEIGRKTLGRLPFEAPIDPTQHRIASLGGVVINDEVEIGANSTVDAGTIRPTRIGRGTKIDNLVQVGHNVVVGEDCLLCAQTAVAGSAVIGDRCVLGGKSGVADNLTLGADCVVGGAAIVLSHAPAGSFLMGYPAKPMLAYRAEQRVLRNMSRQKPVSNTDQND